MPRKAAAWPRCLAAEARVDCSYVSRAPTRMHPLRVGRGASDPLGVRSSRRGSGCGGVRGVPRVHCGLHRRVAPQGRRRSSQRRPVRPRRLVRGLVLDRRVDSLLHRGGGESARPQPRAVPPRTTDESQVRLRPPSVVGEFSSARATTSQSADLGLGVCRATCSFEEPLDARPGVALAPFFCCQSLTVRS
jgi:hypothetical protein